MNVKYHWCNFSRRCAIIGAGSHPIDPWVGFAVKFMQRRRLLQLVLLIPTTAYLRADEIVSGPKKLRGRLSIPDGEGTAAIRTSDGERVSLYGDEQTEKVLRDKRLDGWDFEVHGRYRADGGFEILPIHLAALFTYQDGRLLRVTYYCDVCAIRTYSPGICMCCREETRVDAVTPETVTSGK